MYYPAHARSRTVQPMGGNLKPDLTLKTCLVYSHINKISDQSSFLSHPQQKQIFTHANEVPYNTVFTVATSTKKNQVRKML